MAYPGSIDNITFGQFGSIYTDSTATTIKPPSGKIFSAITMLEEVTFDDLVSKDENMFFSTTADGPGVGGVQLDSDQVFPEASLSTESGRRSTWAAALSSLTSACNKQKLKFNSWKTKLSNPKRLRKKAGSLLFLSKKSHKLWQSHKQNRLLNQNHSQSHSLNHRLKFKLNHK